jgi:hypothetical protein
MPARAKRDLDDGTLVWKKFSNPSDGWDKTHGVTVDSTGVYIVGYDGVKGARWRIEKRHL